ncbi:hypothetical protein CIHG_06604 [Coccidioides immitis H538.4]|uniref:Uncharacterized protein n=1 Tax=Coccidioides immitis H538.4 TaxID=396776 RepID=A0A0J8UMA8_COCIT|nr:hypothetical protein CIHG_06604 [Coccidioides immitis H538.4]
MRRISPLSVENDLKTSGELMVPRRLQAILHRARLWSPMAMMMTMTMRTTSTITNTAFSLIEELLLLASRAHSVCGGPKAVRGVWDQIKPLWRPEAQRLKDIVAPVTLNMLDVITTNSNRVAFDKFDSSEKTAESHDRDVATLFQTLERAARAAACLMRTAPKTTGLPTKARYPGITDSESSVFNMATG